MRLMLQYKNDFKVDLENARSENAAVARAEAREDMFKMAEGSDQMKYQLQKDKQDFLQRMQEWHNTQDRLRRREEEAYKTREARQKRTADEELQI